ncbi:NUDIX hydrolase [Paenibacillus silvisoli]|uniref:NUDIX hydrolase n=1 Tax=Paenibacillus silvisoli TaxID=3110539 RepID=UPI002804FFF9|nr:NUDIX domain-containing protein [Paenibacillus silvisoli]
MERSVLAKMYPNLTQPHKWGSITSTFEASIPPEPLIGNVNMVPFIGGKCVLIRLDNGKWEMPGGTLEPNEHYLSAIRRELMEEAGARLVSPFTAFGAWLFQSSADKPYRPHMPHPLSYRIVGYGEVEIVSAPVIPDEGGENVVAVEAMTLPEAKQHFIRSDRPDLAELYELAYTLRNNATKPIG